MHTTLATLHQVQQAEVERLVNREMCSMHVRTMLNFYVPYWCFFIMHCNDCVRVIWRPWLSRLLRLLHVRVHVHCYMYSVHVHVRACSQVLVAGMHYVPCRSRLGKPLSSYFTCTSTYAPTTARVALTSKSWHGEGAFRTHNQPLLQHCVCVLTYALWDFMQSGIYSIGDFTQFGNHQFVYIHTVHVHVQCLQLVLRKLGIWHKVSIACM